MRQRERRRRCLGALEEQRRTAPTFNGRTNAGVSLPRGSSSRSGTRYPFEHRACVGRALSLIGTSNERRGFYIGPRLPSWRCGRHRRARFPNAYFRFGPLCPTRAKISIHRLVANVAVYPLSLSCLAPWPPMQGAILTMEKICPAPYSLEQSILLDS